MYLKFLVTWSDLHLSWIFKSFSYATDDATASDANKPFKDFMTELCRLAHVEVYNIVTRLLLHNNYRNMLGY